MLRSKSDVIMLHISMIKCLYSINPLIFHTTEMKLNKVKIEGYKIDVRANGAVHDSVLVIKINSLEFFFNNFIQEMQLIIKSHGSRSPPCPNLFIRKRFKQ